MNVLLDLLKTTVRICKVTGPHLSCTISQPRNNFIPVRIFVYSAYYCSMLLYIGDCAAQKSYTNIRDRVAQRLLSHWKIYLLLDRLSIVIMSCFHCISHSQPFPQPLFFSFTGPEGHQYHWDQTHLSSAVTRK